MLQLVKPALEFLSEYKAALEGGWSADNVRADVARREELQKIATDPAAFVAALDDPQAKGGPIKLPDGSTVPRLPGFRRWMWDGAFCGSIGLRWQPGTSELPPHVLGHIGYAVVPWKRGRGYATRALALMLIEAHRAGLMFAYVTALPDNVASHAVIRANGGRLLERFREPAAYGGHESLRFRIDLQVEAAMIALRPAQGEDFAFCRRIKHKTMRWIAEQLFGWDEQRQDERFASRWRLDETRIIKYAGDDVGWLQTKPAEDAVFIASIYLDIPFHGRGIGTQVMRIVIDEARRDGKAVTLGVVKINPARRLYERLGFRTTGEDEYKFYMRRDADAMP
jgi:predicted acetyltransferase/N-acetylglutamate synthase-like GNAT family acetyltransferase